MCCNFWDLWGDFTGNFQRPLQTPCASNFPQIFPPLILMTRASKKIPCICQMTWRRREWRMKKKKRRAGFGVGRWKSWLPVGIRLDRNHRISNKSFFFSPLYSLIHSSSFHFGREESIFFQTAFSFLHEGSHRMKPQFSSWGEISAKWGETTFVTGTPTANIQTWLKRGL